LEWERDFIPIEDKDEDDLGESDIRMGNHKPIPTPLFLTQIYYYLKRHQIYIANKSNSIYIF